MEPAIATHCAHRDWQAERSTWLDDVELALLILGLEAATLAGPRSA
jgi:hypothetical protein